MKSIFEFTSIFIHSGYVDMRKSINGLSQIVEMASMGNLMEPHLFVFSGKSRRTIKILYFDRSGFCLWQKRLEQDKFPWPKPLDVDEVIIITASDLEFILDGVNIWSRFKPVHFENII